MLRKLCLKEYGEEFIAMYDMINQGIPIGNIQETIIFIELVEQVRDKYYTGNHFNPFKYFIIQIKNKLNNDRKVKR